MAYLPVGWAHLEKGKIMSLVDRGICADIWLTAILPIVPNPCTIAGSVKAYVKERLVNEISFAFDHNQKVEEDAKVHNAEILLLENLNFINRYIYKNKILHS